MTTGAGVRFVLWLAAGALVAALIYFDLARRKHSKTGEAHGSSSDVVATDASVASVADAGVVVDAAESLVVGIDAPPPVPAVALYTITEALDDVRSSPLEFVGTGAWFGNFSINACAYRNERVIVVNEYCTVKEQPALGLIVMSPSRGRLKVYAEGNSAISMLDRTGYFTFRLEVQPPPASDPIDLATTYAELNAWEERRYNAFAPSCWSGDDDGCSGELTPQSWAESASSFITEPPASWYTLAKDLHTRAVRDSKKKSSR